jgi:hypothetical protein
MNEDTEQADRYLRRAEEVRTIAESMTDRKTRKMLFQVATDYERMAETMRRLGDDAPPQSE